MVYYLEWRHLYSGQASHLTLSINISHTCNHCRRMAQSKLSAPPPHPHTTHTHTRTHPMPTVQTSSIIRVETALFFAGVQTGQQSREQPMVCKV